MFVETASLQKVGETRIHIPEAKIERYKIQLYKLLPNRLMKRIQWSPKKFSPRGSVLGSFSTFSYHGYGTQGKKFIKQKMLRYIGPEVTGL